MDWIEEYRTGIWEHAGYGVYIQWEQACDGDI